MDEDGALEARGTEAAGRPERAGEREVSEDTDAANPVRRARARRACPPDGPWVHPGDSFPTSRGAWERRGAPGVGGPTQEGPGENTGQRKESWPFSA